jgi:hypothetical protein
MECVAENQRIKSFFEFIPRLWYILSESIVSKGKALKPEHIFIIFHSHRKALESFKDMESLAPGEII